MTAKDLARFAIELHARACAIRARDNGHPAAEAATGEPAMEAGERGAAGKQRNIHQHRAGSPVTVSAAVPSVAG